MNALGTAYKEQGEQEKALQCFRRATAIKPLLGKAYWNRSDLVADAHPEIRELENNLKRLPENSKELPYFHFSLFRHYEKIGNFDTAFAHLQQGNTAKKQVLEYDVSADLENDKSIRDFFEHHYSALKQNIAGSSHTFSNFAPIFIVGMPRSGTSLVEQILASHSQVAGGGEIPLLTQATQTLLQRLSLSEPFPHCLTRFEASDFAQLGYLYQQLAVPYLHGKAVLTDKFLLNYKVIPLIPLILPKAKIVHVRRDPMDTCFGCYRQLFNTGLGFSYDLEDLVKTWESYARMLELWQKLMPEDIHTCEYEQIVNDLESAAAKLLTQCKLDWEQGCLEFHSTPRSIKTASNLQVREQLFTTGMGRWKRYQSQLTECNARLLSISGGN